MNTLDKQYTDLLQDILEHGVVKKDRTGTGTKSVFGRQIRHKMSNGFPLLTTKKMAWKPMVVELLWFLQGDTNIQYLVKNGCHIWDGDAFKKYEKYMQSNPLETRWNKILTIEDTGNSVGGTGRRYTKEEFIEKIKTDDEFAKKWGDLGPIYGKQWRKWDSFAYENEVRIYSQIDQIQNLINDLKNNPDSRRLMVNAWKVDEIHTMTLPPCHYGFQCYTTELTDEEREDWLRNKIIKDNNSDFVNAPKHWMSDDFIPKRKLSLMWNQRSVDTFLGLPFNIASYGLLLIMLADEVNMIPDELIGNLADTHLYLNHLDPAREEIGRELTLEERMELVSKEATFEPFEFNYLESRIKAHKMCDNYDIPRRTREPFPLPTVKVQDGMYCSSLQDVILLDYRSHPKIEAPLSN